MNKIYLQEAVTIRVSVGLTRRFANSLLLGLRVRIPPGNEFLSVVSVVCFQGRDHCDGPITRPEKSYRVSYA